MKITLRVAMLVGIGRSHEEALQDAKANWSRSFYVSGEPDIVESNRHEMADGSVVYVCVLLFESTEK